MEMMLLQMKKMNVSGTFQLLQSCYERCFLADTRGIKKQGHIHLEIEKDRKRKSEKEGEKETGKVQERQKMTKRERREIEIQREQ